MAQDNDVAIRLEGLTKSYGALRAVDDLSFDVPKGAIFGFMGHNGAGKTTTIRMLLGLARPDAGAATVLGHDVVKESLAVRRISGFLPGDFALPAEMTPRDFLAYIGSMFGMAGEPLGKKVDELLDLFGLEDFAGKRLKGFSSGMTQKVGLAQALINDPKVLFLDEPTSGLDPVGRHDFLQYINTLSDERDVTILFSTHILSDIEAISDHVAILNHGRLIAQGTLADLKREHGEEKMDELYLKLVREAE